MKVIINKNNPLTVEDQSGNVLFQWLPEKRIENIREIQVKAKDLEISEIIKQLETELRKSVKVSPKYFIY